VASEVTINNLKEKKMTKEIKVKICVGTYSYVMGGAELVNLKDELPSDLEKWVSVEGAIELKGCDEKSEAKPPFAEINGRIIEKATKEKLISEIYKELSIVK